MLRTFTLNSPEFYELVREPRDRPWIPNGALPREPKTWPREAPREQDVWETSGHEGVKNGSVGREADAAGGGGADLVNSDLRVQRWPHCCCLQPALNLLGDYNSHKAVSSPSPAHG